MQYVVSFLALTSSIWLPFIGSLVLGTDTLARPMLLVLSLIGLLWAWITLRFASRLPDTGSPHRIFVHALSYTMWLWAPACAYALTHGAYEGYRLLLVFWTALCAVVFVCLHRALRAPEAEVS